MNGNLINLRNRSPEDRKRIAQMGAAASAKERKRKAELKRKLKMLTQIYEGGCSNGSK